MRIIFENNHEPDIGKYKDAVVEDATNRLYYVYDSCGTYLRLDTQDVNFEQEFTDVDSVVVEHNLNKYPAVTIIGEDGREVIGEVQHTSKDSLTVSFSENVTGIVVLN